MSKPSSIVGSRELKTRLGSYLERVRRGETLLVTDRGEPVAELRPVARAENLTDAALRRMAAEGLITRGTGAPLRKFKPIRLRGGISAADTISADRDDRF
jgi:prevent-host-death family protein